MKTWKLFLLIALVFGIATVATLALASDDSSITDCVAITAGSVKYTLPKTGDWYLLQATGNTAYLLCGTNPTATTAINGHSIVAMEGTNVPHRLHGPKCAVIGPSAAGQICFVHFGASL